MNNMSELIDTTFEEDEKLQFLPSVKLRTKDTFYLYNDIKVFWNGKRVMCEHKRQKSVCKECKKDGKEVTGLCEHENVKNRCKECKKEGKEVNGLCDHRERKNTCKKCKKEGKEVPGLCEHEKIKSICKECKKEGK